MAIGSETAVGDKITLPVSDQPLVSILIPCRNQAALLETCLKSLRQHVGNGIAYEVIIVLNAATDEVKFFARERIAGPVILQSGANLGVAAGYNRARAAARGEFLLLLHDDTEIEPNWLETLLETLRENPAAGAVGSIQYFPDGTPQRAGSILWQNAGTSTPWGNGAPDPAIFAAVRPVDYVGTCSTLVRTTTWDAVGGMDEEIYPAYYVDVDLCMSIRRLGQTVLCDPRSRLKHHQGASSDKNFRQFVNDRNRIYFISKWAAELASCEPADLEDPAAADRANQITIRRAADLTACWKKPSASQPRALDIEKQEREHYHKEITLLSEYRKFLESSENRLKDELQNAMAILDATQQEVVTCRTEIEQLRKSCKVLKSRLRKKRKTPFQKLLAKISKRIR